MPLEDTEAGYKFFNRLAILPILDSCINRGWFWDTEILVRAQRAHLTLQAIDVEFKQRSDKTSTVSPLKDSLDYLKAMITLKRALRSEQRV